MKRLIHQDLQKWFESSARKPLVLQGARQVGKTYAVNSFGKDYIESQKLGRYHYFDLRKELDLHSIFEEVRDPKKILEFIELKKHVQIQRDRDLLFFDEIQDCPGAISSFKYFEQDMPELAIIAAGSHLGLVKNEESFPVGKVEFLSMFPMTFYEFIWNAEEKLCPYLDAFSLKFPEAFPTPVHETLLDYLLQYFAIGGLPEIILRYLEQVQNHKASALQSARKLQLDLLIGYESDFSKYSGTVNANHIHSVFREVPKQLAKNFDESTSKFKFSGVIPHQKGFDRIVGPLTWLTKSRLCIKSLIANQSGFPLLAFTEENRFKVFYLDVGLLNAALETPMEMILKNELSSYKGFLVENFVAQELFAKLNTQLISWQEGQSEIEFLISHSDQIIPIEVKSGLRSRKAKSLDSYISKYHPQFAFKLSAQNIGYSDRGYFTLPLYLAGQLVGKD